MPGGLAPLKVTVDGIDFSYEAENITFSSADPGGYQMCSFDLRSGRADKLNPGAPIRITDGLQTVWEGRIAEPARTISHGWAHRRVNAATTRVGGEGKGAAFKDNQYSMVYIDRDLSRWTTMSVSRQQANLGSGFQPEGSLSWQVGADPAANPALVFSGVWPWSNTQVTEAWYDAGPFNLISIIATPNLAQLTSGTTGLNGASANEQVYAGFSVDQVLAPGPNRTQNNSIGVPPATTPHTWINTNTVGLRYGYLGLISDATGAFGTPANGAVLGVTVAGAVIYGNHGLVTRGDGTYYNGYLYLSDIAADAAQRAIAAGVAGGAIKVGRVDQIINFPIRHYVQYTPVDHEQVIDEMAKLGPAHYGTWEGSSIFEDVAEWTFRSYGTEPTVFAAMADIVEADLSERLANLFTSAIVSYSDAAGTPYTILVTLPNDLLNQVGIRRTTVLDLGLSSTAAATAFASFALQALFIQGRSAGSVTLPKSVRDRTGAPVASHWLKAGIDRLHISDIPTRAGLFTGNESFRISRVESNVDTTSGEIITRVELDAGPNLVETLQARLAQSTKIVGY